MTVAADLQLSDGPPRRCVLMIEGLEDIMIEPWDSSTYDSSDFSPAYSRAVKLCLHPPEEFSERLSIRDMKMAGSAMTFIIDDIDDTDGKSYWGKKFAAAAWDQAQHWRVSSGTDYNQTIDADATSIPLKSTSGVPGTPVDLYLGKETISYTGTDANGLTGVSKGLYPPMPSHSAWGYTYFRPQAGEPQYNHNVSQAPFSWIGRMVCMYVITYDRTTKKWNGNGSEKLVWAGRIADRIQQRADGTWALSCLSIIDDLNRKIGYDFPSDQLDGINLQGDHGRKFRVEQRDGVGALRCYADVTVAKNHYTKIKDLVDNINGQLGTAAANWTDDDGTNPATKRDILVELLHIPATNTDDEYMTWMCIFTAATERTVVIRPITSGGVPLFCHALQAMGFAGNKAYSVDMSDGDAGATAHIRSEGMYRHYMAIDLLCNGQRLYVDDVDKFWDDQGDNAAETHGNVKIDGAKLSVLKNTEGAYYTRYTAKNASGYLELDWNHNAAIGFDAFVGVKDGETVPTVQQVFVPRYGLGAGGVTGSIRGPFEMILHIILSTGTEDYNNLSGTSYDKLVHNLSLAIPEVLVDKDSFVDADNEIMFSDLARRKAYIIEEATSVAELLQREAILWGYTICWRSGKLTLRPIAQPELDDYDVTLTEANTSHPHDFPDQDLGSDTVVNQYTVILHDTVTGKKLKPITVTDMDSREAISMAPSVELKHPGIHVDDKQAVADALMKDTNSPLLGRIFRYPSPIAKRTLSPDLLGQVFVGDTVRLSAVTLHAQDGTGDRAITCKATVIEKSWNHLAHSGDCTLLLHTRTRNRGDPYCGAALIDKSENSGTYSGGWDATNKKLKLVQHHYGITGDPHDGERFVATYKVIIVETAPDNPLTPAKFWENTVGESGYSTGSRELELEDAITGWDATKEYRIIFGDYGDTNAAQKLVGTWQADPDTELLGGADLAQYYG